MGRRCHGNGAADAAAQAACCDTQQRNRLRVAGRPPCRVFSEAGVALPDRNDTFYVADLAVICEPLRPEDRLIRNPVLIVEVLSPSTGAIDRQIKVPDYRRISSVMEILLIDSESAFAEVHRREGDRWITEMMRGLDALLALNSVPLTILLSEIYEGIALPELLTPAVSMSG